jgi:hypothetical protein
MTARQPKTAPEPAPEPAEDLVRLYPHHDLLAREDGAFLPGVGIDGADVGAELAAEWLAAGLATTEPPPPPEDLEPPATPAEQE